MARRRRSVLAAAATVVGSAFAGCLGGNGGNGNGNRSNQSNSSVNGDPEAPPIVVATYPQFQYDAGNTGAVPAVSGPTGGIRSLFEFGSMGSDRRFGTPSVADGTVYVTAAATGEVGTATSAASETAVSAIDAVTGTTVWEQTYRVTGDPRSTAVTDGTVLAPVGGEVVGFDAATGDQRWSYACGLASGITVADGSVYVVGTQDGATKLYSLSAADGSGRWETDIDAASNYTTPAVAGDTVYVGGAALQAFATDDGSEQWRVDTAVTVPPTVADESVVVGSDGSLRVYDTAGDERWNVDLGTDESPIPVTHPPAVADGTVYRSGGGELAAYDLDSGEQDYAVELGIDGTPVVADDYIYLFGAGQLTCLSADDGETEWAYGTQQHTGTDGVAPGVVDGVAYFPAEQLYAIAE